MAERVFPASKQEALAFLYVSRQDIGGKSPAELAKLYDDAYKEISNKFNNMNGRERYFKDE